MQANRNRNGNSLLRINRLEHEQCTTQVATTLLCNSLVKHLGLSPSFFFPARWSAEQMSFSVGAATLTSRVRDRIGAMMLDVLLARRINRRLGLYFSIVRLRAAWASRVRWSASLITTTLNRCFAPRSTCCVCATSLSNSWTTTRS